MILILKYSNLYFNDGNLAVALVVMYSKSLRYSTPCLNQIRDHQGRSALCDASQDSLRSRSARRDASNLKNERTSSSARLKNNRMVVNGNGNEDQKNEFYPYGGPWGDASTNQGSNHISTTERNLIACMALIGTTMAQEDMTQLSVCSHRWILSQKSIRI